MATGIDIFGNPTPVDEPPRNPFLDNNQVQPQGQPATVALGAPPVLNTSQLTPEQLDPFVPNYPNNPQKPTPIDPRNDPNSPFFGGNNASQNFWNGFNQQMNRKAPVGFGGTSFSPYNPWWGVPNMGMPYMFPQQMQPQFNIGELLSGMGNMFNDTLSRLPTPQVNVTPAGVPGFTTPALNYAGNTPQTSPVPQANPSLAFNRPISSGRGLPLGLYGSLFNFGRRPGFGNLFL
jgi:hypothetical protein